MKGWALGEEGILKVVNLLRFTGEMRLGEAAQAVGRARAKKFHT